MVPMDRQPPDALGALLAAWDAAHGPVPEQAVADASAAFDDLDTASEKAHPRGSGRIGRPR